MTPIDWKHQQHRLVELVRPRGGRQSLVTPIDWKLSQADGFFLTFLKVGRQSLVTPIDWKLFIPFVDSLSQPFEVANPW